MKTLHTLAHVNRWLIRELLNHLLRPVYVAYRHAQGPRRERLRHRFFALLDAAPCYPFCIEVAGGLWILDHPSDCDESFADCYGGLVE